MAHAFSVMCTVELPSPVSDDDRPLAVRRKRRANSRLPSSPVLPKIGGHAVHGVHTPPATPQHHKKRVRFSDGPVLSSGLTSFVNRTSLSTPTSSGRSTVNRFRRDSGKRTIAIDDSPTSGTLQFAPLRQVLDGRIKRRIRRNRLSEEVNIIESEKRLVGQARRETEALRLLLQEKDAEIVRLKEQQELEAQIGDESGASVSSTQTEVEKLETQIVELRSELDRRHSWGSASPHLSSLFGEDDIAFTNFDEVDFNDEDSDIEIGTPSRRNRNFELPSPPTTAPTTPSEGLRVDNATTQVCLPDPRTAELELHAQQLTQEIIALNQTLELSATTNDRLLSKLSPHLPEPTTDLDLAVDTLLTTISLSQTATLESTLRFSTLSTSIRSLGFSHYPDATITELKSQFRYARLELERICPGESTIGFENDKILTVLLERIKSLVDKVTEQDADLDSYHDNEIILREQLGGRVDAMRTMEDALSQAQGEIMVLSESINEKEHNEDRFKIALEQYRNEVTSLENLVSRMEQEHHSIVGHMTHAFSEERASTQERIAAAINQEQVERQMVEANFEAQGRFAAELATRYTHAMDRIQSLTSALQEREEGLSHQSEALAETNARLQQMSTELLRNQRALGAAQDAVMLLKAENCGLKAQVVGEKSRYDQVIGALKVQLDSLIAVAMGTSANISESPSIAGSREDEVRNVSVGTKRAGSWLSGTFARRVSGNKRQKCE